MAYYGIQSAAAVTASVGNDTVEIANLGGTTITAASVYGQDATTSSALVLSAELSLAQPPCQAPSTVGTPSGDLQAHVVASATHSASVGFVISDSGTFQTGISLSTAVTSQQAARIVNGAYLQGNAGDDSIAFGEAITRVSATTFAGGAGNDLIGSYKNLGNSFVATTNSAALVSTNIEGGGGNDTVYLDNEQFSGININANKGEDKIEFVAFSALTNSIVGLGAGNDLLSAADIGSAASSTIAGGKGNDTIALTFTNAENLVIGGDRANANPLDGDGADHVYIQDATIFSGNTIYGGGGNDTVTFSGDITANISLGAGADIFSADGGDGDAVALFQDVTIGLGAGDDQVHILDATQFDSSVFNLGKGADSTDFGGADVGSATDFANTTIYGGAGADYLIGSAEIEDTDTVQVDLKYVNNSESTIGATTLLQLTLLTPVPTASVMSLVLPEQPSLQRASLLQTVLLLLQHLRSGCYCRVEAIASNTSDGNAASFLDGQGKAYLFVKGSTDNLVVQVGSASALSAVVSLGIGSNKDITVTIG